MSSTLTPLSPGLIAATVVLTAVALTGCGTNNDQSQPDTPLAVIEPADEDAFHGTLVEPPFRAAPVTLRTTDGTTVRLDRLPEQKASAVFFGFTNCPDICPTTMADLASARRSLPSDLADQVVLYFVTVDPKRDTPQVLRTWLDRIDPAIVGLRGPTTSVNEAERSLFAVESAPAPKSKKQGSAADESHHQGKREGRPETHTHSGDGYEVNHSGSVYVFGPRGEDVLYTGGYTAPQYAADFARLLTAPQ